MTKACTLAFLILLPATAVAQKAAFIDAFIEFHSELTGTYGDEGPRVEAALERMAAALEVWKADNPATATLLSLLDGGRPADALDAIETAIRLGPERAVLHMLRGVLLGAAGRGADALASFQRAWALDPDDPVNAYLLADRMSTDPLTEPPEQQMAAILAASRPAAGPTTRRTPFIQVALIDDGASDEPQFSRAAYADGFAAFSNGRYEEAMQLFRTAMARDPLVADPVARSGRAAAGIAALRQGRIAEAVADLEAVVAAAPTSSEAPRLLGIAHAAAGNVDASMKWLADAIRVAPSDERTHVAMGRVLIAAGRVAEAERVLLNTIQLLPASGRARWALADLYEKTGRGTDAIEQLEQAAGLTVIAGKAALLWRLAHIAHQLLDRERVVSALTRRTRLIPNDPEAHRSLGIAYQRAGRDVHALIELLIASHLGAEDAEMLGVIGQIHMNAGRLTMAETVLRRAVVLAPASAATRYALATTLLRMGNREEGHQQLAEFRRLQETLLDERREKARSDLPEQE